MGVDVAVRMSGYEVSAVEAQKLTSGHRLPASLGGGRC